MTAQSPIILKENKVPQKTNIPRRVLEEFFHNNIVEVRFKRREKPPWFIKKRTVGHMRYYRRMLCTANWRLIKSPVCRTLFNWVKPKTRRGPNWYRKRNLIIVWDILQNDWRMVSLEKYFIVGYTPVQTLLEQEKFITFYQHQLEPLTQQKKDHFSDL